MINLSNLLQRKYLFVISIIIIVLISFAFILFLAIGKYSIPTSNPELLYIQDKEFYKIGYLYGEIQDYKIDGGNLVLNVLFLKTGGVKKEIVLNLKYLEKQEGMYRFNDFVDGNYIEIYFSESDLTRFIEGNKYLMFEVISEFRYKDYINNCIIKKDKSLVCNNLNEAIFPSLGLDKFSKFYIGTNLYKTINSI